MVAVCAHTRDRWPRARYIFPPWQRHGPFSPCSAVCFSLWVAVAPYTPLIMVLQGYGVYRFAKKYGANVDGYSPVFTPDTWSASGNEYTLGFKGIIAW